MFKRNAKINKRACNYLSKFVLKIKFVSKKERRPQFAVSEQDLSEYYVRLPCRYAVRQGLDFFGRIGLL